ncbi:MAG: hypothetical protein JO006_17555 [Paucibacter sp.]|nr:hypothetical protein [Roseateles sp.]
MEAFIHVALLRLLSTSIHTVALTALVWTVCRILPRLAPAAQCWLWWIVGLQAVVGLCIDPIRLSWLPATASDPTSSAYLEPATLGMAAARPPPASEISSWPNVVFALWVLGIVVMGILTMRQWGGARKLLTNSLACNDALLLQSLHRACAAVGLRRAPQLRMSNHFDSPAVVGHFRPVLLLPAATPLDSRELDMALAHELMHLRRGDLWLGCIPALARHLLFFHPLVHFALREYAIAREADCDAAVVAAERHSRHEYGQLLLRLGASAGGGTRLAVTSSTFHVLKRRLTMLKINSFLPRASSIALLSAVAAIGVMPMRLVAATSAPAATLAPSTATAQQAPAYTGERMTVRFKDTDIRVVLKSIADFSHRNILISDKVAGKITVNLPDLPWDQALDAVLSSKGLVKRMRGEVMVIGTAEEFAAKK